MNRRTLMPTSAYLALALALLAACNTSRAATNPNPESMQTIKHFQSESPRRTELDYLLFLPKSYDPKAGKQWPLLMFLHGVGERGMDVWKVATHGPPKLVKQQPDFPFIVVSPQCPAGQVWSNDVLLALLDHIARQYAIDAGRVYLTGLSMGGYGTWNLGLAHPERFAAIVPICGGGELLNILVPSSEKPQALKNLGVWAFHGAKDPVVPLEESQRMVNALKKAGVSDVKLTVYPEAQHDAWTQTYNNPELYQWLLAHERR